MGGGEASPKGSPGSVPCEFDRTTMRPPSINVGRPSSGLGLGSGSRLGSGSGAGLGSPRFVGVQTDNDDLSVFVQEIDARRPLASGHNFLRHKQEEQECMVHNLNEYIFIPGHCYNKYTQRVLPTSRPCQL